MDKEKKDIIDYITYLYKHDLAMCEVYKDVISSVKTDEILDNLKNFLKDHEEHLNALEKIIKDREGSHPSDWRDLKGILMDLYTKLRSITGEKGALKALQTAENEVLSAYEKPLEVGLSEDEKKQIEKHLDDEKKHGQYLKSLDL